MNNLSLSPFQIDCITAAAHETNRQWQRMAMDPVDPPWEALKEEDKSFAKASTMNILINDFNAEAAHNDWVSQKKARGWTVGTAKSAEAKTHPCLVSWAQLPKEQQAKDELWVNTVRSFVKMFWTLPQG